NQHPGLAAYTPSYRQMPDLDRLRAALLVDGGKPPYTFANVDEAVKKGRDIIPDEYRGVLPGAAPLAPSVRRRAFAERRNAMDTWAYAESQSEDDQIDEYDDEELDCWIEEYVELAKKQLEEQMSRTVLAESEAVPTSSGQGDTAYTLTARGSIASADLP